MRGSPKMPLDARLCIFYILYTVNIVRAAGDCRPHHWTTHGPPFYILYFSTRLITPPLSTIS